MAALMDSYQPESLLFSHGYPGTSRDFDDRELDEGDIVRSKPQPGAAYLQLVNEDDSHTDTPPRQRLGSGGKSKTCTHQDRQYEQLSTGCPQTPQVAQGAAEGGYKPLPPNGQIPLVVGIASHMSSSSVSRTGSGGTMLIPSEQEPCWSSRVEDHIDISPSDEESDSKGMEDSTTALLRRYTMERNGRPTSIHLSPSGEIVGSGWLSEILMSGHKKCAVTLEEDSITWRFLSRKDGEL